MQPFTWRRESNQNNVCYTEISAPNPAPSYKPTDKALFSLNVWEGLALLCSCSHPRSRRMPLVLRAGASYRALTGLQLALQRCAVLAPSHHASLLTLHESLSTSSSQVPLVMVTPYQGCYCQQNPARRERSLAIPLDLSAASRLQAEHHSS